MQFLDVCAEDDLGPAKALAVRVGGKDVALFRVDGVVHALENACPHAGSALVGGTLCGRMVTCRSHGWRFDVTTGALAVAPAISIPRFPVQVVDGRIRVNPEPMLSHPAAA